MSRRCTQHDDVILLGIDDVLPTVPQMREYALPRWMPGFAFRFRQATDAFGAEDYEMETVG